MSSDRESAWIAAATRVPRNAVCNRSGFAVGAALEAADGAIFTGCNVENSTYGLTVCAERVAVWKALSEGVRTSRESRWSPGASSRPRPAARAARSCGSSRATYGGHGDGRRRDEAPEALRAPSGAVRVLMGRTGQPGAG
jgi:hypothetical protein